MEWGRGGRWCSGIISPTVESRNHHDRNSAGKKVAVPRTPPPSLSLLGANCSEFPFPILSLFLFFRSLSTHFRFHQVKSAKQNRGGGRGRDLLCKQRVEKEGGLSTYFRPSTVLSLSLSLSLFPLMWPKANGKERRKEGEWDRVR